MKIGIIVYSQSGNTLSAAQKLERALTGSGHKVDLERVEPVNGDSAPVRLKSAPDVSPYDAVIFASPVQGFTLAPVMKLYLSKINSLSGKKVCCFVTQYLRQQWLGGNRAVKKIDSACKIKGAEVMESGIVNWSSNTREKQIDDIVRQFCVSFGKE